jgi:dethiobiotin synthetase
MKFPPHFFVTGTDTGVGKTMVCAVLMAGLPAAYWKPVQSGLEEITDAEWVRRATGLPDSHFIPEAYRLRHPLSPHAAAALDGVHIELERFHLPTLPTSTHLIVEGAGGIMVPLNAEHTMLDLMKHLGLPTLLVARSTLGTINHTLLSLEQLQRHQVEILGVVINGPRNSGNRDAIQHYGRVSVLAEIEPLNPLEKRDLRSVFASCFGEV